MREDDLIARYFRPLAGPGSFDLRDDAAVIPAEPGTDIVTTVDAVTEGIDYFPGDPPEDIAARALRVNLSDLAAKGAKPFAYLCALALGPDVTEDWVAAFASGLAADQQRYGVTLLGGDTGRANGATSITITAFGRLPSGTMLRRDAARPGDRLVVTGTIGDAALGLALHEGRLAAPPEHAAHLLARFTRPEPRVALAEALRTHARAALDVSDGLILDLTRLSAASGLRARIDASRVPLSPAARAVVAKNPALLPTILTGGDDYEVLAAIPTDRLRSLRSQAFAHHVGVTDIGAFEVGEGPPIVTGPDGRPLDLPTPGWDHFAAGVKASPR